MNFNSKKLIPFLMAGYPSLEVSERLIGAVVEEGVEIVEIGFPFSDPLADGPVIQRAAAQALTSRIDLPAVLKMISRLKRKYPHCFFILFTYLNPLLRMGIESYVQQAVASGLSATLTVDLPPEEAVDYLKLHDLHGLKTVFLASPTTSSKRMKLISAFSTAFVYYISRTGVTGEQTDVSKTLEKELRALREIVDKPIAVGFGVATPAQVATIGKMADGVVIGSRLLSLIENSINLEAAETDLRSLVRVCLQVLHA